MKKIIAVVLALTLCLSVTPATFASSSEGWEHLVGLSGKNYFSQESLESEDPNYSVNRIFSSAPSVDMAAVSYVEFVDIIAETTDGQYVNISEWANATMNNSTVARYDRGRIDAIGSGSVTVYVNYGGKTCSFEINVLSAENPALEALNGNGMQTYNLVTAAIRTRALAAKNYTWTPTSNLKKWGGTAYYYAGVAATGIPYSRGFQCWPETSTPVTTSGFNYAFGTALGHGDFYTVYTYGATEGPRYGLDCAGYVSYCSGVSRHSTYTFLRDIYNGVYGMVGGLTPSEFITGSNDYFYVKYLTSTQISQLQNAYSSNTCHAYLTGLVATDHAMLIIEKKTDTQEICVIEQVGSSGIRTATYTYSWLAQNGYIPFTVS